MHRILNNLAIAALFALGMVFATEPVHAKPGLNIVRVDQNFVVHTVKYSIATIQKGDGMNLFVSAQHCNLPALGTPRDFVIFAPLSSDYVVAGCVSFSSMGDATVQFMPGAKSFYGYEYLKRSMRVSYPLNMSIKEQTGDLFRNFAVIGRPY